MKTILLIRHSEPVKDRTMPTAELPLSEQGHRKAQALFSLDAFRCVAAVYTSPYRRAYSTAEKLRKPMNVDARLRERELGKPDTLHAAFWKRQYADHDYKNVGGESLNDVKARMTAAIDTILSTMQDGSTVAVVSHAAAICAFLLNWCTIEVTDEQKKLRKITKQGAVVMNGILAAPSAFVLTFENDQLCGMRYIAVTSPWIFFDVGSTLIDETEAYDHRARDMIAGTHISFAEFDAARIAFAQQGLEGNSAALQHFGLAKTPWPSEDEIPYSDAHCTLAALRQKGYKLGIIANQTPGTAERLQAWDLDQYFDVIAASAEIGYAKPDRAIFETAFALAGCSAAESVMVGDRLDHDIIPAKALGMKTVWIKRGLGKYQSPELGHGVADYQIDRLSELLGIL